MTRPECVVLVERMLAQNSCTKIKKETRDTKW